MRHVGQRLLGCECLHVTNSPQGRRYVEGGNGNFDRLYENCDCFNLLDAMCLFKMYYFANIQIYCYRCLIFNYR